VTGLLGAFARAEAVRVRVPFVTPIRTGAGEWTHRESWIVLLFDEAGRVGLGEAALGIGAGESAGAELGRQVREAIERLGRGQALPDGAEPSLAGALDAAVLGLRRDPFAGGAAASVALNATVGYLSVDETVTEALAAVAAGFGTLKMKVGPEGDTAELVERVAAVREAVGATIQLRLDVNGAWDIDVARERIAAVAAYDIEYVEQPVAPGDPNSLAGVRSGSPVRIGADESVSSVEAARELLALRAADVLVIKPVRVGGPTAARQIAALAAAEGVPVVLSTLFETGVGIATALAVAAGCVPMAHGLATAHLLESDLLLSPLEIKGGRMALPARLELDEEAVGRFAVERVRAEA
jgi:o-succinylbenzoate synthase